MPVTLLRKSRYTVGRSALGAEATIYPNTSQSMRFSTLTYLTDPHGERAGFQGRARIFRNGTSHRHVAHYCPTQADSDTWIAGREPDAMTKKQPAIYGERSEHADLQNWVVAAP